MAIHVILLVGVLVLGVGSAVAVARAVASDGYGERPTPRSHRPDLFDPELVRPVVSMPSAHAWLRGGRLLAGLALYGAAIALMLRAQLGVGPWDVLAQGIARTTGLPFGVVVIAVGALLLVAWWPLRQRPGVGTVANVLLVGTSAQVVLDLTRPVDGILVRSVLFLAGMALLAVATAIYVGAGLGAGPRDGLMLGLHRRLGVPIWLARTAVEGVVLLAGWLLGGNVGPGTLVFALGIGPLCGLAIRRFAPLTLSR